MAVVKVDIACLLAVVAGDPTTTQHATPAGEAVDRRTNLTGRAPCIDADRCARDPVSARDSVASFGTRPTSDRLGSRRRATLATASARRTIPDGHRMSGGRGRGRPVLSALFSAMSSAGHDMISALMSGRRSRPGRRRRPRRLRCLPGSGRWAPTRQPVTEMRSGHDCLHGPDPHHP
jgi:hypothetical protein